MPAIFGIGDCETGGLDHRINPILSFALVLANEHYLEVDGFATKLKPPPNSWLEVPVEAHQIKNYGFGTRNIDYYLNLDDWSRVSRKPESGYLLNPSAVELNGFVQFKDEAGGWDLDSVKDWLDNSISLELAEEVFIRWMIQHCPTPPIGVAHNAIFDTKYVQYHMPLLFSYFATIDPAIRENKKTSEFSSGWFCTCSALKKWNKVASQPGENAKLGTLAKLAGYEPAAAHEALADTRSCLAGLRWLKTGKKHHE